MYIIKKPIYISLIFVLLIFSLAGCAKTSLPEKNKLVQGDTIQEYLGGQILKPVIGGKMFSAYKILREEKDKIYIWALVQEYCSVNGKIIKGSGGALPMVLDIERTKDSFKILGHKIPRDGMYGTDIKTLFPSDIQTLVLQYQTDNRENILQLIKEVEVRALQYYSDKASD